MSDHAHTSADDEMYAPARLLALQPDLITPLEVVLLADLYTFGRATSCTVVIRHPLVSRLHARIERQGAHYVLIDAGSANGTFVGGARVRESHTLHDDDVIGFGSGAPLLRFVDPDATAPRAELLEYDQRRLAFFINRARVELPPMQFRLLHHLYQHAGDVCSRESCAMAIWGRDFDPGLDAGALDQALNSLRKTLRRYAPDANLIETRRGLGYLLHVE